MPQNTNVATLYPTAKACKLAGTNRDTFLRWVREGSFPDVARRDRHGWRLFTQEDIQRLSRRVKQAPRGVPSA